MKKEAANAHFIKHVCLKVCLHYGKNAAFLH